MKKTLSIITLFVLILTIVTSSLPVSSAANDGADIPVIHVHGYGALLVRNDEEGKKETVYPLQIPDGYIEQKAEEFLPVFAKAFFTQEWSEFCDVLTDILVPIFEPMSLDKNGEASDGSRADWTWSRQTLRNKKNADGKYSATAYPFHYDWRLDPYVTADTLHRYIEDVLYVTGEEKVALYGRCLGSNVVAAYMEKYDGEYVQDVIHYASSVYGATQCSKAFAGELHMHADGIDRFMYDIDLGLEIYYTDLIQSFVSLLNKTYGLDVVCWAINNVAEDIYLDIFPEIMRAGFGTFPSYWSMVSLEDYDRAMETVFYGVDKSEYAGLIEKTENYHNNVRLKFEENTKADIEKGIGFANIVKYGMQTIPVTVNSDELSDQTVTVRESSFGATTVKINESFSDDYIKNAVTNSTAKFISPDKQIDASTCLYPEKTWFIKNLVHDYFPSCVNGLVSEIINNDGYDVFSSAVYPQYLVFDDETQTVSPMTANNMNTTERWHVTFFEALRKFFAALIEMLNISMAS